MPLVAVAMTDATDLNLVRECYGAVAAAVQVVWPDCAGVLPWEEGSSADRRRAAGAWAPSGGAAGVSRQPAAGDHRAGAGRTDRRTAQAVHVDREGTDPQRDNDIRAGGPRGRWSPTPSTWATPA